MDKKAILIIGACEKLIYNSAWNVINTLAAEDAIEKSFQHDFDVVVFTNGLQEEEKRLRKILTFQNPKIIIIQNHRDELLAAEINKAVEKQRRNNRHTFSFVDDALKNAVLPIIFQ